MVVTEIRVTNRSQGLRFETLPSKEHALSGFIGYLIASPDYPQSPSIFKTVNKIIHLITHFIKYHIAEQPAYLQLIIKSYLYNLFNLTIFNLVITEETPGAMGINKGEVLVNTFAEVKYGDTK